jgi:hypothetical protein
MPLSRDIAGYGKPTYIIVGYGKPTYVFMTRGRKACSRCWETIRFPSEDVVKTR